MMMPPLPLLEKPAKQEFPQPVRATVARMNAQQMTRRRPRQEECWDWTLDRDIRPSVESAPQATILRRMGHVEG